MNFNTECGVGAVLKLVVRKADTDEIVRETPEFHNLVLTTGLERMAANTWIDRCCVGTGNSNPIAAQTALDSFLASTISGISYGAGIQIATEPFFWFGRCTWRFAVGTATGNISEVGLGWGNSNLWNRALVKDTEGNPTTITVLADEYLDVISEVRVYPKNSVGSFNLVDKNGAIISTHSFLARPRFDSTSEGGAGWDARVVRFMVGLNQSYAGSFGVSTGYIPIGPTGTPSIDFSIGNLDHTALANGVSAKKNIASSEGNIGSHRSFSTVIGGLMCGGRLAMLSRGCGYNWEVDPPIPKDAETILTYSFTLTWGNYEPT